MGREGIEQLSERSHAYPRTPPLLGEVVHEHHELGDGRIKADALDVLCHFTDSLMEYPQILPGRLSVQFFSDRNASPGAIAFVWSKEPPCALEESIHPLNCTR